LTSVAV